MTEFIQHITGGLSINFILAYYFWAGIGVLLHYFLFYIKKKDDNIFSIKYFIENNWMKLLTNVIVLFVVLRFQDIIVLNYSNMYLGFIAGLSITHIIKVIKNYSKTSILK